MRRTDAVGSVANRFTDGDKVGGIPATRVTADFMNIHQEEICSVISAAGLTLDQGTPYPSNDTTQLTQAILKLIVDNSVSVDSKTDAKNLSITASVAANALTVLLKDKSGNALSALSKGFLGFRSATISSGLYNVRAITSGPSLVVPSGATLGGANGVAQYVYLYAIDYSGAVELAIAGSAIFDEATLQSTTALSSGSTSGLTLYSGSARSNVPVRLLGRMLVSEATAGTWASAPTEITTEIKKSSSEFVASSSVLLTPSSGGIWTTLTNNSVKLTPGRWKLTGQGVYGNNGNDPTYGTCRSMWGSANGANTSTTPAALASATDIAIDGGYAGTSELVVPAGSAAAANTAILFNLPELRLSVDKVTSVFANLWPNASTPSFARIQTSILAERIQ